MVFCGQCGFHLPSGITRCPRCGTVAAPDTGVDVFSTEAPTVELLLYNNNTQNPQGGASSQAPYPSAPFTPPGPQKLVLHAGSGNDYNFPGDNEPTSALNAATYRTHTPTNFQTSTPSDYAGSPAQAGITYQNGGYVAPNGPPNIPQEGFIAPAYPIAPPKEHKKGSVAPLLVALFGLLLVLGVATFLLIERTHIFSNSGTIGNGGGVVQNTPPVPTEQAKGVVQHYYASVNNKNYQEAYGLWKWDANAPSFATFKHGYANTEHDALTIKNATQLGDGTIKVVLTIVATERVNGSIQYHTYAGYYIVGQDNSTWKIFRGILARVG